MKNRVLITVLATVALGAAACGGDDDSDASTESGADRTIEVEMVDTAYNPDSVEVSRGETVRFVFTNSDKVDHDAFIGDKDAQADHEAEMRAAEKEHGGRHGEEADDAITVEPDDTGELTHTFDEAGALQIGCHEPGHYKAGMTIDVTVS